MLVERVIPRVPKCREIIFGDSIESHGTIGVDLSINGRIGFKRQLVETIRAGLQASWICLIGTLTRILDVEVQSKSVGIGIEISITVFEEAEAAIS